MCVCSHVWVHICLYVCISLCIYMCVWVHICLYMYICVFWCMYWQIQLVSLPQLDQVQRSLKVLDVRLQHLHSLAIEEDRLRQDVEHILLVIMENQKVLSTVVLVLMSLQEEIRSLGATLHQHQATNFTVLPPSSSTSGQAGNRHSQVQGQSSMHSTTGGGGRKKSSELSNTDSAPRRNSKTFQ